MILRVRSKSVDEDIDVRQDQSRSSLDTLAVQNPLGRRKNNHLGCFACSAHNFPMTAGTVLRQLRSRLQQLLRRRGQTREDAEDVIQDAFLRLQVYYRKGGQVREPEAFLVRTAMRLAINHHRDARRRIQAQERVKTLPLVDMEPAPEEMMAAEQTLQSMARKLDSVSRRTREVFLLHRVDGLSYAQISKLYGMTTKAVERRIARAMLAIYQDDPDAGHERSME